MGPHPATRGSTRAIAAIATAAALLLASQASESLAVPPAAAPTTGAYRDDAWLRQFFDVHNDDNNRHETTISRSNVGSLHQAWSSPLPSGGTTPGPLVAADTVFVATETDVVALNRTTGARRWQFSLGDGAVVSGLAMWNTLLYATAIGTHRVYALDRRTGRLVWSLGTSVGPGGLTVIGKMLVFNDLNAVRAVDTATGSPIWTADLPGDGSSYPAYDGRAIYLGGDNGKLSAIDPNTGALLWQFQGKGGTEGSIALSHGVAYFGTTCVCQGIGGYVFAVDTASHLELWRKGYPGPVYGTPAIGNGLIYVSAAGPDDYLRAVDPMSGAAVWYAYLGAWTTPTVANGVVYATGGGGLVKAFDAATGAELWTTTLPSQPDHVVVVGGVLYVGNGLGDQPNEYAFAPSA